MTPTAAELIAEINRLIKLESNLVRHLLISRDEIIETPRKIRLPHKAKPETGIKESIAEPAEEKAKIEEIDKKLEELLEQ